MIRKIVLICFLMLFLNNCGYTPIYSKKNQNFEINKIELIGNLKVNKFLSNKFKIYKNNSSARNSYDIILNSALNKTTITKDKKGKDVYWVIDWKTAGDKGWFANKKRDILTWAQIALYKSFWMRKNGFDTKQVKCGFVLLKRGAKPGSTCELVKVSVGPKAEENALSIVRSMVKSVRRGIYLKNRNSCLFCEFKGTPHCPG